MVSNLENNAVVLINFGIIIDAGGSGCNSDGAVILVTVAVVVVVVVKGVVVDDDDDVGDGGVTYLGNKMGFKTLK